MWIYFHVRKDVAPLKQKSPASFTLFEQHFHVRKDVAPLKRLVLGRTASGDDISTSERMWLH